MGRTLDQLKIGQCAYLESIGGEGAYRRRLLELGLTPGVEVELVGVAPLGDPLTIRLEGSKISLRRAEASQLQVRAAQDEPEPSPDPTDEVDREPTTRRVVVVGSMNAGKTTLFNALTGGHAHVDNYPGASVEQTTGRWSLGGGLEAQLVDVPGTYSLYGSGGTQQVAFAELIGLHAEPPDAVIVVLDATAMRRSMYLLLQVQELGLPTVVAVNMLDEAERRAIRVDAQALSHHLDLPVVGVVARNGRGLDDLRRAVRAVLLEPWRVRPWHWRPSEDLEAHLDELSGQVEGLVGPGAPVQRRRAAALWALMSLADDEGRPEVPEQLCALAAATRDDLESHGHDLDLEVTHARYQHIDQDLPHYQSGLPGISDRIDSVLTHPVWGSLTFLVVMSLVFTAIFDLSEPFVTGLERLVGLVQSGLVQVLPPGILTDLVVEGVLGGVGAVVMFLPQILILFLLITILEGSGYMARGAYVIDRLMTRFGLHGQSFVPLVSGFACCVPAILATRSIDNRRDRLLTIMILPLISCSARLPVYTLIIAALFPAEQRILGPVSLGMAMLMAVYVLSTGMSVLAASFLSRTVLKGEPAPFLLELPPYRLPPLHLIRRVLWERTRAFLQTAGTVIVLASVVLWALLSFPNPPAVGDSDPAADHHASAAAERSRALEYSYAGRVGKLMEPAIEPLGFDWQIGVALVGSLAAREVFVATMGLVHGVGDQDQTSLRDAMRGARKPDGSPAYTPLTGVSLLVFFMIALQCISTLAVTRQETGSWRWTAFQFGYLGAIAYLASLLTYQGGLLLGFG